MKINAVSPSYYSGITKPGFRINNNPEPTEPTKPGLSVISFKGGNKDHVLHVVAEADPFAKEGGVATVVRDYQTLNNASATEKGKAVVVMPFYNGSVEYAESTDSKAKLERKNVSVPKVPQNLPDNHPLKGKEGQPLFIKPDLSLNTINSVIESKKGYWLLEEVASKNMNWGFEENNPIKLFKVVANADGSPFKDEVFMVFSEATAYDPKPYSKGQYSSSAKALAPSWGGDPYAKYDKAVVELMPDISKRMGDFDPGTVVCSDAQAAYVTHFMAEKNAEGVDYFKDKKPMQIAHNLGDGYIGKTSARNMIVNLDIFTPEELKALSNSEELRNAIVRSSNESEFWGKYLSKMQVKNKLSAMSVPIHYGQTGFLPVMAVVSQGYLDEVVQNPEIAPYIAEDIKSLKEKNVVKGYTNPLNSKNSAFTQVGLEGYRKEQKVKLKDGSEEVIQPLKMLTEKDRATLTLEDLRKVKRENKINFLKRFTDRYDGAEYFNNGNSKWEKNGANFIRRGNDGAIQVLQTIDKSYIERLEKGEDIKVAVSWGRGDFQKALDEVLNGFKKYVQRTGDKDTLLVMGGDLAIDKVEGQKVKDIAELLSKDPMLQGRILLLDAFAPGEPMAWMADTAILPSRTMPCELTDLEAKKMLCTPIVPNGQGMGQKNFDPGIATEAATADAFKTKHQYYNSRDSLLADANEETKASFNKVYNKIKNEITSKYKLAIGKDPSPDAVDKLIIANEDYNIALRKLRDEVMTDDIATCLERCLIEHRNDDVARTILKNQINMETGWENNQKITRSEVSTGELYRQAFHGDSHNITNKGDVIGYGIDKTSTSPNNPTQGTKTPGKVSSWLKENKKVAIITGCVIAAAGIGYAIFKGNKNKKTQTFPKENTENNKGESKHLSTIG